MVDNPPNANPTVTVYKMNEVNVPGVISCLRTRTPPYQSTPAMAKLAIRAATPS